MRVIRKVFDSARHNLQSPPLKETGDLPIKTTRQHVPRRTCAFLSIASISMSPRILWTAFGVLWLGTVLGGLSVLANYDNTPGVAAHAPTQWPTLSVIARDTSRPTLIMLAHPRCVCTRASLTELGELMARAGAQRQRPKAYVIFIKPGGVGTDWENTELWQLAHRIPDVTIVRDDNGREAQRFGAETSGQTLLYDASGRLIFGGGTTGSRGHPGDNIGRATILALLDQEATHTATQARTQTAAATTNVYGCALFDHASQQN
jgi:hypothetical protein